MYPVAKFTARTKKTRYLSAISELILLICSVLKTMRHSTISSYPFFLHRNYFPPCAESPPASKQWKLNSNLKLLHAVPIPIGFFKILGSRTKMLYNSESLLALHLVGIRRPEPILFLCACKESLMLLLLLLLAAAAADAVAATAVGAASSCDSCPT